MQQFMPKEIFTKWDMKPTKWNETKYIRYIFFLNKYREIRNANYKTLTKYKNQEKNCLLNGRGKNQNTRFF